MNAADNNDFKVKLEAKTTAMDSKGSAKRIEQPAHFMRSIWTTGHQIQPMRA